MTTSPRPALWDQPHHDGSELYVACAAPALGDSVEVRVRVPASWPLRTLVLRSVEDGEPRPVVAHVVAGDEHETWYAADLLVHNPVTTYRFLLDGADGAPLPYAWLNAAGVHPRDVTDAHDFRVVAFDAPPAWVPGSVVYQVFPDRFARSGVERPAPDWALPAAWDDPVVPEGEGVAHQWFGGDLDGVREHLDHLVDLGVDVLYLTPVFTAGSNHRYDASTFEHVDPVLGGDEALQRLVAACHERGLRVMTDLTTNHTGDRHEWFEQARRDPAPTGGAYRSFYRFTDHPDGYVSWLGVPTLPKLDHADPDLRRAMYEGPDSVVGRWLHDPWAVDGWRIDVANMTGRYADVDQAHDVARALRATMTQADAETGRTSWLLAEHGHDASLDLAGDGWHGTMNYAGFSRPVWSWLRPPDATGGRGFMGMPVPMPRLDGEVVLATIRDFSASMPWRSLLHSSTMLGSHDTPRVRTAVGGGEGTPGDGGPLAAAAAPPGDPARALQLVGLAALVTMPGVPMVFAGDEIGLVGVNGEHARTPFPWDHRDRWDAEALEAYRAWLRVRRTVPALADGGLRWLHAQADSLTFLREHPAGTVLVHLARAAHPPVRLPAHVLGGGVTPTGDPDTLYGEDLVVDDDATATLPSLGPAAHAYLLRSFDLG